ncbi:hypothetical protein ACIKT0_19325, partial [Hansschlegelia beijingensis]
MAAADPHESLRRRFRWRLPARFSIAEAICDRWARRSPGRTALLSKRPGEPLVATSYGALRDASQALAAALVQTFPNAARPQCSGPAWALAGGLRVIRDP